MGPVQAITTCLAKSFQYSGRASRSEFWWFAAFWLLLPEVVAFLVAFPIGFRQGYAQASGATDIAPPNYMWATVAHHLTWLVLVLPGVAVIVRRLHDISRSAWWFLLPLLVAILLIILMTVGGFLAHATPQTFGAMGKQIGAHLYLFILICSLPLFWLMSRPSNTRPNPSEALQ